MATPHNINVQISSTALVDNRSRNVVVVELIFRPPRSLRVKTTPLQATRSLVPTRRAKPNRLHSSFPGFTFAPVDRSTSHPLYPTQSPTEGLSPSVARATTGSAHRTPLKLRFREPSTGRVLQADLCLLPLFIARLRRPSSWGTLSFLRTCSGIDFQLCSRS
jgi:hypothetical protein